LVMTVTGTVLMECVFAGKPIACLGDHAMASYPGVRRIGSPDELGIALTTLMKGELGGASESEAVKLIQFLHQTSYPAELFDPLIHPEKLGRAELRPLIKAFTCLLEQGVLGLVPAQKLLISNPGCQ
jgi:hypothetical protein